MSACGEIKVSKGLRRGEGRCDLYVPRRAVSVAVASRQVASEWVASKLAPTGSRALAGFASKLAPTGRELLIVSFEGLAR
jgi:hypothetical protein